MILAAPVEGERRGHHPAVAHRHQVLLTGEVLLLEQGDRVGTVRGRDPSRMTRRRRPLPCLSARGHSVVDARMGDVPHCHPVSLPLLMWRRPAPGHERAPRARLTPERPGLGDGPSRTLALPDGRILLRAWRRGHHPVWMNPARLPNMQHPDGGVALGISR